jgi:hypothetical protein
MNARAPEAPPHRLPEPEPDDETVTRKLVERHRRHAAALADALRSLDDGRSLAQTVPVDQDEAGEPSLAREP